MGGAPQILAIRTTSLVAPPSPPASDSSASRSDDGDNVPELWLLGVIAAVVVLVGAGCVVAVYYHLVVAGAGGDPLEYDDTPLALEVGSPSPFKNTVHPEALPAPALAPSPPRVLTVRATRPRLFLLLVVRG
jgi:hypothetical protein